MKSKLLALVALAGLLLAAQCDNKPPAPPPEPTVTAPPEPPPAPPVPPPQPPAPPTPPPPDPSDSSRCAVAWRNAADVLHCPPKAPPCHPDAGRPTVCASWLEFCKTDEANGISAGSKCLSVAKDCAAVEACQK